VSLDELRADLKRNLAEAARVEGPSRAHLKDTMWPFMEALVDIVEEMDDAIAELVDQQEDYLQTDTAAVFAALVQSSLQLAAELRKHAAGDELLAKRIDEHEKLCQQAIATLGEITMIASDDADEEDDDEADEEAPDA